MSTGPTMKDIRADKIRLELYESLQVALDRADRATMDNIKLRNELALRDALPEEPAVAELAAVKEALDAAGAYVGGSLASRVQSLDIERRRLIDEARAAVQNDTPAISPLADRLEANWLLIGEFFASRNWPDTKLGRAASDLNADVPRILRTLRSERVRIATIINRGET